MKFSVLIPVYNTEKYLEECLQSVLNQTYQDFEIVLVDDGSTDNSPQICDSYQKNYPDKIKVIHQSNQGQLSSRCQAVKNADGDYLIFVDSDDFIEKDLLFSVYHSLKDNDIDVLLFSLRYYSNGTMIEQKHKLAEKDKVWSGENKKEIYTLLATSSILSSLCTKAIRTILLKDDPTDYKQYYKRRMAEDLFQSLYPMTSAKKVAYINNVLYNYRTNANSVSHSFNPEKLFEKSALHVYNCILNYLPVWGIDTEETLERMDAKWLGDTMYLFSRYYESAKTHKERNAVLRADWNQLLPERVKEKESMYENKVYRKIYNWLCQKQFLRIRLFFIKKQSYKKIIKLKRIFA